MRLPPEPLLMAALRWLDILPSSGGVPRAQSLLTTHPGYSDLTPTQYATALSWLRDIGLMDVEASSAPSAMRLLAAIFEKAPPPWVQDADDRVRSSDELPSDVVSAGEAIGLHPEDVYQQLVSSWGKVDAALRAEVGTAGELALVELLRANPSARVDHVASWSDGFGYDIDFHLAGCRAHLEVKSSIRSGRFIAYLSRHEYTVMMRDSAWVLVTVRLTADHRVSGVGSVPREWITANAPADNGRFGTWATLKLEIPAEVVIDGIPELGQVDGMALPVWGATTAAP